MDSLICTLMGRAFNANMIEMSSVRLERDQVHDSAHVRRII